jgi:protein TonB
MLTRLLESRANHERSLSGAVASVAAHTGLIGFAIYATAHGRIDQPSAQMVRPVYFVPSRVAPWSKPSPGTPSSVGKPRLVFVNPTVSIALPSVDIPLMTTGAGDFPGDPIAGSALSGAVSTAPDGTYATFRADQVEKQVSLIPGSASPTYPEALRTAGREGKVVAQFVVDEDGRVEEMPFVFALSR